MHEQFEMSQSLVSDIMSVDFICKDAAAAQVLTSHPLPVTAAMPHSIAFLISQQTECTNVVTFPFH